MFRFNFTLSLLAIFYILFVCSFKAIVDGHNMSSFHKSTDSSINGTKVKNNLPYISTGIPSLDHIIGGGLPRGTIFAVAEDVLGTYSRVLIRYFLAEGVVCKHALFIASVDENPQDIVKELPQPIATQEDEVNPVASGVDKMKIAWRYEGLGQVESSFGANSNFGHHFDLSKHIDEETIKNTDITYCTPSDQNKTLGFDNSMYFDLLTKIKAVASKPEHDINSKNNKNILRISIQSLGSPIWTASNCEDSKSYARNVLRFMHSLRTIIRDTNAVALVTLPAYLFDDEPLMKRVNYSIDNAVRIESFAGSSKETNPVYKDYHGLFHIIKLSAVHSLVQFVPPSKDLAFKLKRKKFVIEKLHLPPELQETSEREQDDITSTPTCGGFKKTNIDF